MKTVCSIVALCAILSCAALSEATRLERVLLNDADVKGNVKCIANGINGHDSACKAAVKVSAQAFSSKAKSLAVSFAAATSNIKDIGSAKTSASAFAVAVAKAYAEIVSKQYLFVYVSGNGKACAFSSVQASASATAFAEAIAIAFAESSNDYAVAIAKCFADAVAHAFINIFQSDYNGLCTNGGYHYLYKKIETLGFVKAYSFAFSHVYTQVYYKVAASAGFCKAFAFTYSGSSNVVIHYVGP